MTIQELADRASVTTRTIRYYVEQGVLPPPERGRPAEYTDEHIKLLDLVRRLKEQYLPLEEIRDMLQRLTPQQLEEFLGGAGSQLQLQQEQPESSAADYISQVLNRGALRTQLKEQAMPPPVPAPVVVPRTPPNLPPLPVRRAAAAKPPEVSSAATPHEAAPTTDTRQGPNPYMSEERTWQRVSLAPGVELHYEASAPPAQQGAIRKIIEAARTILGSNPEKGTEEQK